jgi:hypothetical protein
MIGVYFDSTLVLFGKGIGIIGQALPRYLHGISFTKKALPCPWNA